MTTSAKAPRGLQGSLSGPVPQRTLPNRQLALRLAINYRRTTEIPLNGSGVFRRQAQSNCHPYCLMRSWSDF
jgi:hypothetical protein